MKSLISSAAIFSLAILTGCSGPQPTAEQPPTPPPSEPPVAAAEPPPAAEAPAAGTANKIEVSYEFGAWGPCDKQRIVYTKDGDSYSYARICDDTQAMNTEAITAEQFRQAVFIEDYLAGAGRPLAELPASSYPKRCGECTKCYRSPDEVLTACQNSAGVVSYSLSNPAALGKTDSNKTRWLISYTEQ
jgi:hypothetical protein